MRINITAAKIQFSRLIDRAAAGEEVVITRHGRPVVRLVAAEGRGERRKLGLLAGRIRIADDFDAQLPVGTLDRFGTA